MFHGTDRRSMRETFARAWTRHRGGEPLGDLERQIAAVIEWHPEYHALLENPDALERDFTPDGGQSNPFLHMGLHLAVRDQLGTDRPAGIRAIFDAIRAATDEHAAEHVLLERLGAALWRAQRDGRPPDEAAYLAELEADPRRLAAGPGDDL